MLYNPNQKDIEQPLWKGLVTGTSVPGGCNRLINLDVTDGGRFLTRCNELTMLMMSLVYQQEGDLEIYTNTENLMEPDISMQM